MNGSCGSKYTAEGKVHTCRFQHNHPGPHRCLDCSLTWASSQRDPDLTRGQRLRLLEDLERNVMGAASALRHGRYATYDRKVARAADLIQRLADKPWYEPAHYPGSVREDI